MCTYMNENETIKIELLFFYTYIHVTWVQINITVHKKAQCVFFIKSYYIISYNIHTASCIRVTTTTTCTHFTDLSL